MESPRVLIIVPAFNEAHAIEGVIRSVQELYGDTLDILVINDGSSDNTGPLARRAGALCVDLPFNMGIGNAVHTGYLFALRHGYNVAVQFDGDGQHPADGIGTLLNILRSNSASIAIGSRFLNHEGFQSTLGRRLGIQTISFLIKLLTGHRFTDPTSGFRAVDARALKIFSDYYPHDYPEPEALIVALKNDLSVVEVPVVMKERQGGVSSIGFFHSILYMIKVSLAIWVRSLHHANH